MHLGIQYFNQNYVPTVVGFFVVVVVVGAKIQNKDMSNISSNDIILNITHSDSMILHLRLNISAISLRKTPAVATPATASGASADTPSGKP